MPRERAWELVTEHDELREWLADDVEFEAEEGAPLRADDRDGVVERRRGARSGSSFRWGELARRVARSTTTGRHALHRDRAPLATTAPSWGPKLTALASCAARAACPA